ncbi:MAG: hypothetical protein QXX81_05390 [Zestosphaera sp.]
MPLPLYVKYNEELTHRQRKIVREALRQFFTSLVLNVNNVSSVNVVGSNYSFNVNININNVASADPHGDVWAEERVKQLERKLRKAEEVLREYKFKASKYEKIAHLADLCRRGTIDARSLLQQVLQAVDG